MKIYKVLILACCTLVTSMNAQTARKSPTAKKDTLIQRDLIMEKEYQPEVQKANKLVLTPEVETQVVIKQPLIFSITESPTALKGEYTKLPAAEIKTTYPSENQIGYIRIGVGSRRSFLGDAQVNLLRQPKQFLDINFQHRSIFGDLTNLTGETQRAYSNQNNLMVTYKLHLTQSEIDADVAERYLAWNYYGSWRIDSLGPQKLSIPSGQWSSDSKFGFTIKSKNSGQPFSYRIHAEGHHFRLGRGVTNNALIPADSKGGREKELKLQSNINYDLNKIFHIGLDGQMRSFNYRVPASWPVEETTTYPTNTIKTNFEDRHWFEFSPYAKMTYKKWMLSAGFKMSIPTLLSERVKGNILASASTALGEKVNFKATLDGGVQTLSYREGLDMNPYLDPAIRLKSNWKPIALSAIIDYRPTSSLRLSPILAYDVTKDMPFFYNGYPFIEGVNNTNGRVFSVKYMNSNRFKIGINGLYNYQSIATFQGEINYNKYLNFSETDLIDNLLKTNGRKAWYKPGFELHLRSDITPFEDLNLFVDYRMQALRFASDIYNFSRKLDNINDLSLGAQYKVAKNVGMFLHLNNLLDERYEIWNAYQTHGFTAVIGGSVTF